MGRRASLGLVCLFLFLAAFPPTLVKPGLPVTFKADEAAYYMMAQSLAFDRDLRLGPEDTERVFREFPYRPVRNLIVMTDDGWRSVRYGKPYLYSLAAAPFVALWGANGMLWLNVLLILGMIALGTVWLGRWNEGGPAALFSAGFFLLGAGFAYVFWLQPEVFNMAAVTAALFFGLDRGRPEGGGGGVGWWRPQGVAAAALSGAALALAVYNKPMLAALGLPVVFDLARRRRWAPLAAWIGGAALALAAAAGLAVALTGHATSYLGVERQGVTVCEPGVVPIGPGPGGGAAPREERPTGGAWSWIFRVPDVEPAALAENLGYFLWGRHTGLFLYFPFTLGALVLFLVHGRREGRSWVLAGSLAAVALFFLLFIPANWQGGGGFVGNRYFVAATPGFLFLVTRLSPRWLIPAGYLLGGLLLGPMLLSPFGPPVPEPTLQWQVRNAPLRHFPLELSLREVPGYHRVTVGDVAILGRKDVVLPRGDQLWLHAATSVELRLIAGEPLERVRLMVTSVAPDNRVTLELGDAEAERTLGAGESWPVELAPGGAERFHSPAGHVLYSHRLVVTAERGRVRSWTRRFPPDPCPYFPTPEGIEEGFAVGAELTYLGRGEGLDRDVFAVRWGRVEVPERVTAGEEFEVATELVNASGHPWTRAGAARVQLSYHWRTADGELVEWNGLRTPIELPVSPGGAVAVRQRVAAPGRPGRYVLELDPVFEFVAWFSERNGGNVHRAEVEVVAADGEVGGGSAEVGAAVDGGAPGSAATTAGDAGPPA
jgi:hypothetical protein